MKLKNNSTRTYIAGIYRIEAGQELEINDKTLCQILLNQDGIEEAIDKQEFNKVSEENELNKLKIEALELGIKFSKKIGYDALLKKVEEFKKENLETVKEEL